jgi:hypothetical protein
VTVGPPIAAEQGQGGEGEREVAILGPLSAVDMDHHTVTVDIRDFEMESFVKPQSAGVYG